MKTYSQHRFSLPPTSTRGFTLIEVMMALGVMVVGALGIVAMQQASTRGNINARQMTTATQITRTWIERLRLDSMAWNIPTVAGATSGTSYLTNLPAIGSSDWFTPQGGPTLTESAGFDWFGNDVALAQARYCTHVNLTWIDPGRLVRADVRTFWHRRASDANTRLADARLFRNCALGSETSVTNELANAAPRIHAVHASTLLRWTRIQ